MAGAVLAAGAVAGWLYGPVGAAAAVFVVLFALGDLPLAVWLDARVPRRHGLEAMAGANASIARRFVPTGTGIPLRGKVRVRGELWYAHSHHPSLVHLEEGETVRVEYAERLTLRVVPPEVDAVGEVDGPQSERHGFPLSRE